ncbi:all-alpha NTP pyrophosphatase-like protein [Pseudomonas phage AN14]|uniref:All-alpha NTP pyrophosphatase-like protein n=1 Tax=Pseudomonas phage AN14 TaxID=1868597 RepID=A0A1B0Z2P2_9CAUD|nr:all-alpha NTP pyrophosphatase-like protein [Pseudomonas phage AN14]
MEHIDMTDVTAEYIDNQGVADFADAMRRKLEKKRAEGRGGWHDPDQCQLDTLAVMLLDHLEKGDPVDIGNFAMMLYNRGDGADGQPSVLGATFREWLDHQLQARDIVASNLQAALDKAAARIAELEGIAGRLEGERNEARRSLDKEREVFRKELEAERDARRRSELNLARAQGYIDRVTEGEPPLPGVRNEVHERVGQVGVSYISGPDRRGPRLDLGEPHRDPYQFR